MMANNSNDIYNNNATEEAYVTKLDIIENGKKLLDQKNEFSDKRLVEYFFVLSPQLRQPVKGESVVKFPDLDDGINENEVEEHTSALSEDILQVNSLLSQGNETFQEAMDRINCLGFDHTISARFPLEDYPDNPLTDMITSFCHPKGEIQVSKEFSLPKVHYFVSTGDKGQKLYGCCLTIYEPIDLYSSDLSDGNDEILSSSSLSPRSEKPNSLHHESSIRASYSLVAEESLNEFEVTIDEAPVLYLPKCICILSKWPYFASFREYLAQLYRLSTMPTSLPVERYVMSLCKEIPVPPPGSFEVQANVLNSSIKFWAPPANQPIAWASLPFSHLFSCLSIDHIVLIWHALTLERQILLVSSQLTLLSTCAEILISFLFPLEWPHMYIPVLPHFLTPVLDAPMPYLCGIDIANFDRAKDECLSAECIVVNLDENIVTFGLKTPVLPPLPTKRKQKLERALELNAGNVFDTARCLRKTDVKNEESMTRSNHIWRNRLNQYDGAFSMAYTPDSESVALNEELPMESSFSSLQSARDAIQEAFLRFFVSLLKHYRNFLLFPSSDISGDGNMGPGFRTKAFITKQHLYEDTKPYLKQFCVTQLFDTFVTKRLYNPGAADVIFFDQSIDAKLNRSMLKVKKVETPFLQSTRLWRKSKSIRIDQPISDKEIFNYSCFPSTFDKCLFGKPRPFPPDVYEEYSKYAEQEFRLRTKLPHIVEEACQSTEVATFTLFFLMFTSVIGAEVQELVKHLSNTDFLPDESLFTITENDRTNSEREFVEENLPSSFRKLNLDKDHHRIGDINSPSPQLQSLRRLVHHSSPSMVRRRQRQFSVISRLDEARSVADAQLSLAFEALYMMKKRKMLPDTSSYKHLINACGRCGDTTRATLLIGLMHEDGIVADSIVYSCLLNAFSVDNTVVKNNQKSTNLPHWTNGISSNPNLNWNRLSKKTSFVSLQPQLKLVSFGSARVFDGPDQSKTDIKTNTAKTSIISMANSVISKIPSPKKISNSSLNPKNYLVTEGVSRQLVIGEMYLDDLYPGLHINVHGERCPKCDSPVSVEDIQNGWIRGNLYDETTRCPRCSKRFTPRFTVKCTAPRFVSTIGVNSPLLICIFLSPWVMKKKIEDRMATISLNDMIKPSWRNEGGENAEIWWNLILSLLMNRLPITFLLQGSVKTRLITPLPDESS